MGCRNLRNHSERACRLRLTCLRPRVEAAMVGHPNFVRKRLVSSGCQPEGQASDLTHIWGPAGMLSGDEDQ